MVSVCTGSGNLSFMGSVPAGIFRHVTVVNVGNNIPDGWNRICQDRTITITVSAETDCLNCLSISEISCPVIYLAGSADNIPDRNHDKTRKSAPSSPSYESKIPGARWERMLSAHTNHKIAVSDYSRPGLTTESFREKGLYAAIIEYSRPGDFCFFQFDPSGQSLKEWKSGGICRQQLARYIIECRERFLFPVLVTPAVMGSRKAKGDYISQLQEQFLSAYREVSELTTTPVIELHKLPVISYDAYVMAGLAAREIARVCGAFPERRYRFLANCMGSHYKTAAPCRNIS